MVQKTTVGYQAKESERRCCFHFITASAQVKDGATVLRFLRKLRMTVPGRTLHRTLWAVRLETRYFVMLSRRNVR